MTMLRISERTHFALRELARERGEPMSQVVEDLIERARVERFFAEADTAYQRLRDDSPAWDAEQDDRAAWDATLGDGLKDA